MKKCGTIHPFKLRHVCGRDLPEGVAPCPLHEAHRERGTLSITWLWEGKQAPIPETHVLVQHTISGDSAQLRFTTPENAERVLLGLLKELGVRAESCSSCGSLAEWLCICEPWTVGGHNA